MRLALIEAASGKIGTIVDRILLTCYRFDPATRRFGPFIRGFMRIGGVMILGAVALLVAVLFRAERKRRRASGRCFMNELLRRLLFLPLQRSTVAKDIDALHYFVISVTLAGSVLVFAMAAIFVIRYRRPSDEAPRPNLHAADHYPAVLYELGILIGLMVLFLAWWVIGSRQYVRLRLAPDNALEVYVTGKQWMWKFAYPNGKRGVERALRPRPSPHQAHHDVARCHSQLLRA